MRQVLFTLTLLFAIGLSACKKNGTQPDIKQYDQQQIQAYIAANGLTGFQKDTTGKYKSQDTTGIWYKIITSGTGKPEDSLGYSSALSCVYAEKSFDNKFVVADTILDHFQGFVGHIPLSPPFGSVGLMMAMHNIAKYKGCKIRLLVPSHMAFGVSGTGTGSSTVSNGRIAGNQCIDYTINTIVDQAAYDQIAIANYMARNNLTGYTKTADGLWYKVTTAPTGANNINMNSTVTATFTGQLLNNTVFDDNSTTAATFTDFAGGGAIDGFAEGLLLLGKGGGSISIIMPSALGYGTSGSSGGAATIPPNACLRFNITVTDVTN
ncbi:MAG TPA: FKBP-type peptidyl-prolyl cis-trans isomerase [Mucilaginibacter sp.]|jgi:FKBP-type peptidyl-prolyl cis-trans isomerase|nr:FKBP-type peptidyl-prolyl cis-trans isomerase [Mucilaginibacter sp.]